MTLVPLHSTEVRGVEGKPGELAPACAAPGCISKTQQRHHLFPRSYLRGHPGVEWVRLPDGKVVQNTVGLCVRHHEQVTGGVGGHQAMIVYQYGVFLWCPESGDVAWEKTEGKTWWEIGGPLFPQPGGGDGEKEPTHAAEAPEHGVLLPGQTCPECGYTKPRKAKPGPKREARSWMVMVPADGEIGADILDGWIDDFAAVLGLEKKSPRLLRYHVLAVVLAWANQNKPMFVHDVSEAGES